MGDVLAVWANGNVRPTDETKRKPQGVITRMPLKVTESACTDVP